MTTSLVDRVVNALLYEGYLLYPYRPAVKNVRRWTFGGLYPRAWSERQGGTEPFSFRTQCLVAGDASSVLQVSVRFLHLWERRLPDTEQSIDTTWQEAAQRRVELAPLRLEELLSVPFVEPFEIPAKAPANNDICEVPADGRQAALEGTVLVSAERVAADLYRTSIVITNGTPMPGLEECSSSKGLTADSRLANEALLRSFASTHAVVHLTGGEFVSLIDPPADRVEAAKQCYNDKLWPVLVGEQGQRDTLLCSPIILYDYPQIAPESPGDLFDATEIDEILTLRIMTLTDDEKRQIAALDERGRALLARTGALAERQLADLHGTIRSLRPIQEESGVER
jgi:hypothetical protein